MENVAQPKWTVGFLAPAILAHICYTAGSRVEGTAVPSFVYETHTGGIFLVTIVTLALYTGYEILVRERFCGGCLGIQDITGSLENTTDSPLRVFQGSRCVCPGGEPSSAPAGRVIAGLGEAFPGRRFL